MIDHFSALDDPRQAWKVEYPLAEIMLLVLCATLAGAETFVEAAQWGRAKPGFLRGLLPFKRGIPSHDALNDVINALDAELFFADPGRCPDTPHETADAGHGRTEIRRHFVSHDVDWLGSSRRFPGEPRFPGLKAIAMVEAIVENKATGVVTTAKMYFISSMALDVCFLAKAVRAHWGVENRLHWVLDVVFHDDLMHLRTENGPKNMATVKHMALNLVKSAPGNQSLRVKRKAAGRNDAFLLEIIRSHVQ